MRRLAIVFLTALLAATSSVAIAKVRHKTVHRHPVGAATAPPEDPEAYAMRTARRMWPGRALCDFGGYRIVPCDIVPHLW